MVGRWGLARGQLENRKFRLRNSIKQREKGQRLVHKWNSWEKRKEKKRWPSTNLESSQRTWVRKREKTRGVGEGRSSSAPRN